MPLLIVGTHREPAQGSAIERVLLQTLREPGVQSLDLAGLQHDAVSEILERRLGAPASDALLDRVFTATGGNPFFVAEVARLLAQRGTVPDGAPSSFPIPQSLRDTVRSRLAEAPAKAQELLAVAAVAGPRVHLTLLRRVLAFASEALLEALDTCQTLDLLRQVGPGRYEFIHGFVRETLYEALPRGRRALLHRDVGDALEVLSVATPGSNLAEIAHHFSEAAGLDRALPAIRYARHAAQRALSVSAPLEALAQLRRALATLEFLTEPDPELHAELHVELCEALCAIDAPALEVGRECDEAARLAQLCQRWDLYARAVGGNAYYQISKNMIALLDPDRSPTRRVTLGRLEEALERLGEAHPELRVGLLFAYGSLLEREGPPERAMAVSDEMLLLADRLGDPGLRSRAIAQRCYMRPDLERIERRVEAARLSAELGRAAGDPSMEVFAHTLRASLELQRGDRAEAEAAAQHILSSESDARISTVRPVACFWRCLSAQLDGRLADAHHWSLAGIQRGVELNFSDEFRSAVLAAQQWWLQQLEGNTAQLVAPWEAYLAEHPDMLSARIPLARLYSESGQLTEARAALEGLGPEPLATLPRDDNWLFFGAVAADVCADVGDTGRAAYFLELLEPYAGRVATAGWVLSTVGAVARPLARLHAALGRHDDAEEYFERALALHHQLSSPPLVAWTQLDRARSLVQRGRRSDTARIRQLCAAAVETVRPLDLPALVARAKSIA